MYLPEKFTGTEEQAFALMENFPFATLLGPGMAVSHLPLLARMEGGKLRLQGHMARANSHWRELEKCPDALAIFHGPHAYISPLWYRSGRDVPTWNYAVVHARGRVRLMERAEELETVLGRMTEKFEPGPGPRWSYELPEDLQSPGALEKAIVGFELEVESLEAKFKLSQNRSPEDREGVREGLLQRGDETSLAVNKLMDESENRAIR